MCAQPPVKFSALDTLLNSAHSFTDDDLEEWLRLCAALDLQPVDALAQNVWRRITELEARRLTHFGGAQYVFYFVRQRLETKRWKRMQAISYLSCLWDERKP